MYFQNSNVSCTMPNSKSGDVLKKRPQPSKWKCVIVRQQWGMWSWRLCTSLGLCKHPWLTELAVQRVQSLPPDVCVVEQCELVHWQLCVAPFRELALELLEIFCNAARKLWHPLFQLSSSFLLTWKKKNTPAAFHPVFTCHWDQITPGFLHVDVFWLPFYV